MAKDAAAPVEAKQRRERLALLQDLLALTQQALLLVDLDGLAPLLDRKDALILSLRKLDEGASAAPQGEEQARLMQAILENEQALEARMDAEQKRVRQEMRELEQQSRLRRYLQPGSGRSTKVDMKR